MDATPGRRDPQPDSRAISSDTVTSQVIAWCENGRTPALLVTEDCYVIWANEAARVLLGERDHFHLRSERLGCVDPAREASFAAFIRSEGDQVRAWTCDGESGSLVVIRDPVRTPDGQRLAGLTLFPVEAEPSYVWSDFGPSLGLTRSEAQIAQKLVDGTRAEAAARELGVCIETVRTHIRRIYNKLGISSREELFAQVSPFRLR